MRDTLLACDMNSRCEYATCGLAVRYGLTMRVHGGDAEAFEKRSRRMAGVVEEIGRLVGFDLFSVGFALKLEINGTNGIEKQISLK